MATLNTRIVLRNDTAAAWLAANPVLLLGEIGVETDTRRQKVGDGTTAWNDLPYMGAAQPQLHLISDEAELQTLEAANGDFAVLQSEFTEGHIERTLFYHSEDEWHRADESYNAENVYFPSDITVTEAVGNIKLTNGSGTIPAKGRNVKQVFEAIWTKENLNPTVTVPSISLSVSPTTVEGEVGTSFAAPTATLTISGTGAFQFGSKDAAGTFYAANATSDISFSDQKVGVAATASALTDENAGTTAAGTAGTFTDAAQTQKFSASASHSASSRKAVSNLGNFVNAAGTATASSYETAGKGIAAATLTKNGTASFTATGFRAWFVGMPTEMPEASELTSAYIRNLTSQGKFATKTLELKPGAASAACVVIAVPASNGTLSSAILTSSMNTDITEDYEKNKLTVNVEGANGATAVPYNVYWYKPAQLGSDEVHSITVLKK